MKKFILSVLCLTFLLSAAFFVTGCQKKHTHTFTEQTVKDDYLSTAADCTNKAKYYYSCSCGEKGTETFEYGEPLGHNLSDWKIQKKATETEKGLKTRHCTRIGCSYSESEDIPMLSHTHKFTAEIAAEKYLATAATCTEKAKYYYSCSCGKKGSETFEYGETLNHSFTNYVSDNNATCTKDGTKTAKCDRCNETDTVNDAGSKLNHSFTNYISDNNATCTKDGTKTAKCDRCNATDTVTDIDSKLGHEFTNYVSDNNATYEKDGTKTAHCNHKGCAATNTVPDEGSKLESKMSFKTLTVGQKNIDGNIPVYGKVSNAQKTYSFIDEVLVAGNIQYIVSLDIYGIKQVATKTIPLQEGDNVVYITEQLDGNPKAVYEVTIRRREIYTVTFNPQGGTAVERQEIEEDSFAVQPASPTKKGYTFNKWAFDFSSPITKNTKINAEWDIIHYNIYYNLNGGIVENENPATYTVEDTIVLNVPEKTGYDFKQWDNDGKIEKGSVGDVTFTAFYTIIVYKINYDCGWGDNNSENLTEYTIESETITLKDAYYIYADFIEWQKDGQKITEIPKGSFGNLTVSAVWDMYDVKLKESDGNYTVIGINTDKGNVVIKSSYKGKPVTSIGSSAFSGCSKLTSVTIPESITSIGSSAFNECSALTNVIWNAENCASEGSSSAPIFKSCYKLVNLTIGKNVKHIPLYTFYEYNKIANIYITDLTAWCKISDLSNIMNYGSNEKSLYLNEELVTDLIIPDGVTSIGDNAFSNCSGLTSVTIGNGVTSIGEYAFYGCSGLTSVTIGNGVTGIGEYAFYGCSGLTSITIPDNVTSIGDRAFGYCSGFISVTIGNGVTSIGDEAFSDCIGLTSITIDNGVASIGSWAFSNCSGLTEIHITDLAAWCNINGLYELMEYESNNKKLYLGEKFVTDLVIPDGVTSIGDNAFSNCNGLTSVTIPDSVTSIGRSAFSGCSGLTSVTIGNGVTSIGSDAFSGCNGLTSVTIPNNVASIGVCAFSGCTELTSVIWNAENCTKAGYNRVYIKLYDRYEDYTVFKDCSKLTNVTIGNNVKRIPSYAFYLCKRLTNIYITDLAAWCNISGLGNLMNSGLNLYLNGELATNLIIPNVVTTIASCAFYGCGSLTSVTIGNSVTSIGDNAFRGCSGLTSITIPDSVTSIRGYAFYGCSGLTSITIPDSVTNIGDSAFRSCSGLTNVTIGNSVTNIGYEAFSGCSGLTSVTIGNGVTSIGSFAFYGCSGLTSITIPDSVTSIERYTFYNCSKLTSVTIGNGVTTIEYGAFNGCSGLTSITIPDSVTNIGYEAFSGCSGLTSVTIGNSVTSIERYAFENCSGLTNVTIPDSVTNIGDSAFKNCSKLKYNEYDNALYLGNKNNSYVVLIKARSVDITSCSINVKTKVIWSSAFNGCSGLTSITIPDSVTNIGGGAFSGCSKLTSVTIGNGVTTIGGYAFSGCSGLTNVTIPDSVTSIGGYAFEDCGSLKIIDYKGDKRQWRLVDEEIDWNKGTGTYTIYCTDGTISK